MHERLSAAGSVADRRALLAESDRVMGDGVALMRQLKQGLGSAVAESGEIQSAYITQEASDKISDYLGLMELLIQLKGDRDAIKGPAAPTMDAEPSANTSLSSAAPAAIAARLGTNRCCDLTGRYADFQSLSLHIRPY
jgi:hypothetical protein